MSNNDIQTIDNSIAASTYLEAAADVVRNAKTAAARSVNLAMVYAYFEVGRIIVEEEQGCGRVAPNLLVHQIAHGLGKSHWVFDR